MSHRKTPAPAQLQGDVVGLRLDTGNSIGECLRRWIQPCQLGHDRCGARDLVPRPARLTGKQVVRFLEQRRDALRVAGHAQPTAQLVNLARSRRGSLDLVGRVLGKLEASGELLGLDRQLAQRRLVRAQRLDGRGNGLAQLLMSAVRVENVALPRCGEQTLLLVLAVDLDQRLNDRRQPAGSHALVVDARDAAPLGGHLAYADERLEFAGTLEERLDSRAGGTVAHETGVGAGAHHQSQRVDQ